MMSKSKVSSFKAHPFKTFVWSELIGRLMLEHRLETVMTLCGNVSCNGGHNKLLNGRKLCFDLPFGRTGAIACQWCLLVDLETWGQSAFGIEVINMFGAPVRVATVKHIKDTMSIVIVIVSTAQINSTPRQSVSCRVSLK